MSGLQAAFNSAPATPPCPLNAAKCSAVLPSCKDEGVSRQSGAGMLHCCPYRESNTQIEVGGKNQGIRCTHSRTITRILCMYSISKFVVLKVAHACNANRRKHAPARPLSFSLSLSLLSLSLSLSLTYAQAHTSTQTHARNMSSRLKTHQTNKKLKDSESLACSPTAVLKASYTSRLRPHTLVSQKDLIH